MPVGTLKWFDPARGCASIALGAAGPEIFAKLDAHEVATLAGAEGQRVIFRIDVCERLGREVASGLKLSRARPQIVAA